MATKFLMRDIVREVNDGGLDVQGAFYVIINEDHHYYGNMVTNLLVAVEHLVVNECRNNYMWVSSNPLR